MNKLADIKNSLKLRNLSKKKIKKIWTVREEAIKSIKFWSSFNITNEILDNNTKGNYDKSAQNAAYSLSKRLISVNFVVSILFMKNVMYKILI